MDFNYPKEFDDPKSSTIQRKGLWLSKSLRCSIYHGLAMKHLVPTTESFSICGTRSQDGSGNRKKVWSSNTNPWGTFTCGTFRTPEGAICNAVTTSIKTVILTVFQNQKNDKKIWPLLSWAWAMGTIWNSRQLPSKSENPQGANLKRRIHCCPNYKGLNDKIPIKCKMPGLY